MIEDVPLPFDMPPRTSYSNHSEVDRKPLRSVAWGRCPGCNRFKAIGLVPLGKHLVWREHTYPTYGGRSLPCRASLTRLCEQPARQLPGVSTEPPKCRCQE